jgi:hypothetical protein
MEQRREIFEAISQQLNVRTLFVSDTGPTAFGTLGEEKPAYAVVGFDLKPDVYKFPRNSHVDTVLIDGKHIHTRFYSPEKFLRMAMNSAVGALEIVSSPKQFSVSEYGKYLQEAVAHYFNPSLMWESVTGTILSMTHRRGGEMADILAPRAVHIARLYMIRAMLEDGMLPTTFSMADYMGNRLDAPSHEKVRSVYEWAIIDGRFETELCPELTFEALRTANPVANVHPLQKNKPGFSDFANETLAKFMAAL